jgi:hypothetical protein
MNKYPSLEIKESSYLEKIGVSQKETVIANILRYFFDPNENHGLGDLFIKALLKTKAKDLKNKDTDVDSYFDTEPTLKEINYAKKSTEVEVEVLTFNNNKIDIVINTEELVVAIEFKINHNLDNPLDDYVNFIKSQGKIRGKGKSHKEDEINSYRTNKYKGKKKYFVVLTPFWKKPVGSAEKNKDFVLIILASFINNVKEMVSSHWEKEGNRNTHQFYNYQDFIKTIENRGRIVRLIIKYSDIIKNQEDINQIEELYKKKELDQNVISGLNIIESDFDNKIKKLRKILKKEYKPIKATKDRIESAISKRINDNVEYKIRLSFLGWYFEKWEWTNGKGTKIFEERIGDYFSTIDDLSKEVEAKENEMATTA